MPQYFDNTRLQDFRRCPRYYYFRHERDWVGRRSRVALVFGGAWHDAMDAMWERLSTRVRNSDDRQKRIQGAVEAAHKVFMTTWQDEGMPSQEEISELLRNKDDFADDENRPAQYKARNPSVALDLLYGYAHARYDFLTARDFKLLAVEQPFAISISEDPSVYYCGRLDKVFEREGRVFVGEHKTTTLGTASGELRAGFVDSFSPNSQIDGYAFAASHTYGDRFKAVWIDAALVSEKHLDTFKFIPIERNKPSMEAWAFDVRYWIDLVRANQEWLATRKHKISLEAFPRDTSACHDFNTRCEFADLCRFKANPAIIKAVPDGYRIEHWEPFDELELSRLGLKQ